MKPLGFRRPWAALALLALAACEGGATGPAAPAAMVAMRAATQEAVVGMPVPVPPAVHVSDARGRGVAGVAVTFTVTAGDGTATASVRTDVGGVAVAADWVMGVVAQENAITATVAGLPPVVFRASAAPAAPVALEKAGGDAQSGTVATALPDSISVRVVDRYGNGIPGIVINFGTAQGTLSAAEVVTRAQGLARVALVLPTYAGLVQVHGYAAALEQRQIFQITARAAAAATIIRLAGDGQSAETGSPVAVAPTVRVRDRFGNSVPGHPVVFTPAPGSGTVTGGAAVTDESGVARVGGWVLGEPGSNRLLVSAAGLDTLKFNAISREPCRSRPYTLFTTMTDVLLSVPPCNVGGRAAQLYSFVVPSQQCVDLFMSSSAFDTYLYLLDAAGNLLASDDDSGVGLNSWIRITLPAGSYLLGAAPYSTGSSGPFSLSSGPCSSVTAPQHATSKQTP